MVVVFLVTFCNIFLRLALQDAPSLSYVFSVSVLSWNQQFPKESSSFHWNTVLETKMWALETNRAHCY